MGVSLWSVGVISFNRRDVTLNESGTAYGCSPYLVKAQLSDNLKAKKEICFKIQAPVSLPSSSRLKLFLEASHDVITSTANARPEKLQN